MFEFLEELDKSWYARSLDLARDRQDVPALSSNGVDVWKEPTWPAHSNVPQPSHQRVRVALAHCIVENYPQLPTPCVGPNPATLDTLCGGQWRRVLRRAGICV
jgi:hypothetical protein